MVSSFLVRTTSRSSPCITQGCLFISTHVCCDAVNPRHYMHARLSRLRASFTQEDTAPRSRGAAGSRASGAQVRKCLVSGPVCLRVCLCLCLQVFAFMCVCAYACACVRISVFVCARVPARLCLSLHTCDWSSISGCLSMSLRTYVYVRLLFCSETSLVRVGCSFPPGIDRRNTHGGEV